MSYAKGRVYKIIHCQSEFIYIGSTMNTLRHRWYGHVQHSKQENKTANLYTMMRKHGVENFKIILIKEYQVEDKYHLRAYEQLWINITNCVNQQSAFSIEKLWNRQYNKQYHEANKHIINPKARERSKAYYETNRETINAKRQSQADEVNEKRRNGRFTCVCGSEVRSDSKARHNKTKKHLAYLDSL